MIRGGHSWLRLRVCPTKPLHHGDQTDGLIALNQDTLDRHLQELAPSGLAMFNSATDAGQSDEFCADGVAHFNEAENC